MHKKIKKQISNANSYLKKSHKIISILVVFLLISTVMASAASSARIGSRLADRVSEEIKDAVESEKPLKTYIAEKAEEIKDKAQNVKEKLNEKITQIKENRKSIGAKTTGILSKIASFVESIRSFLSIRKSAASGKYLYTKYADNEPIESKMYILKATKVDLNDDGINDIEARYKIRPGLERSPLALSCNIALTVKRIDDGFKHLDINESFEAYIYMTFPGLLNSKIAGNQVKFGYHSEKGEEIPSLCDVKYTYVPYFLYVAKPLHRTTLNAGSSTDANKLGLIFSYLNNQAENKSKDIFDIQLEPVVDTTVTFCGLSGSYGRGLYFDSSEETKATIKYTKYKGEDSNFTAGLIIDKISDFEIEVELTPLSLGGGRVEYYKNSTEPLDVTLFFEKNSSAYIYAEDIPDHILFSWEPLKEGLIQLNSFGDRVSEVGIRNALEAEDVTTKAYIANLPSLMELRLDWKILRGGELTFYTDTSGCSAHLESSDILGNETQLFVNITSNENINISLFWSFINKTIGVKKTNTNISIAAYVIGKNGTMANFSCNIKNTITQPFVFNFGKLFDGNFEVEFTGNAIEINDLEAYVFIPGTGSFAALMEQFLLYKESGVTFSFNASEENNVTTVTIIVEILDGLIAKNISFWHNTTRFDVKDITANGYWYKEYNFYIQDANVEWGGNAANGYLRVYGESNVTFTFFSIHKINGELISRAKGSLSFETEEDDFYVQWNTTEDGNKTILMDGGGVLALSGFELWVKDRIDVSIPLFLGSFSIDSANKSGEIVIFLDDSVANIAFDVNISFANQDGFAIAASSSLHVDGYFELIIGVNKGVNNSKRINVTLEGEGLIQLSNANFYAKFKTIQGPAEIDMDLGYFELDLNDIQGSVVDLVIEKIDGNRTFGINTSSFSGSIASFQIVDFSASFYEAGIPYTLFLNISEFTMDFSGSGGFLFELSEPDEDGIQYLTGGGEIFDEDGLIYIENAEIEAFSFIILIEEFRVDGPTTFHLDARGELNFEGENFAEKLENFKLEVGCDANWSADRMEIQGTIGLAGLSGFGDISVGAEIYDIVNMDLDLIVHIDGSLSWTGLLFLGSNIGNGDFDGDLEVSVPLNLILAILGNDLTYGTFKINAYEDVIVNQIQLGQIFNLVAIDIDTGIFELKYNNSEGLKVDINSTTTISLSLGEFVLGKFAFSFLDFELHPGFVSAYITGNKSQGLFEIISDDSLNPSFGRFIFKHVSTGENITFKDLILSVPYLKFGWNVDGDLDGYIAIDTNNELISMTRTRIFGIISITGGIQAEDFNLSWDLNGGILNWRISYEGTINLERNPVIAVYYNNKWWYWPPGSGGLDVDAKAGGINTYGGVVNVPVQFNGSVSGGSGDYTYYWTFGDDGTADTLNPMHTYTQTGSYDVTFTVIDNVDGTTGSDTAVANIYGPVEADLDGPSTAIEHDTVTFTCSAIEGAGMAYYLDIWFGDGDDFHTRMWNNPELMEHTYTEPGTYNVTLQISDLTTGDADTDEYSITITNDEDYDFSVAIAGPTEGVENVEYTFIATVSGADATEPYNFEFDFGDGQTETYSNVFSNSKTVTHTYDNVGNYNIDVTVEDDNFESTLGSHTIDIYPNDPPILTNGYVTPTTGTDTTTFTYSVTYTDSDGDMPTKHKVFIDGVFYQGTEHDMTKVSGTYETGAVYEYSTTLSTGTHTFHFEFDDGNDHPVELPAEGSDPFTGPSVEGWVSPTGYHNNGWSDGHLGKDEDTSTFAESEEHFAYIYRWEWTNYIDYTWFRYFPALNCDQIRFYAWEHDNWCKQVEIEVYRDDTETWEQIYSGTYANKQWEYIDVPSGPLPVRMVRARFYVKASTGPTTAELYEIDFHHTN